MGKLKSLAGAALSMMSILLLVPATQAHAQFPRYLHAISDLRSARSYLEQDRRPEFAGHRQHAIDEISKSIDEMKKAARDDGKNPGHTPPPQSGGDPSAPIHTAMQLLDEAYNDVAGGADAPENLGLQARSLHHIDEARHALHQILDANR
jgi:hypothetical protein